MRGNAIIRKALLVSVALLAVATSCGKGVEPSGLIKGAGARAIAAKTAKVSMSVSTTSGGTPVSLDGTGALNFSDQSAQFSFDLAKLFQAFGAAPKGTPSSLDFVFAKGFTYFKAPPGLSVGKAWLKIDTTKLADAAGAESFSSNPASFFDALKGVSGKVTKSGSEKVRGVDTTVYKGTIDTEKAVAAVAANQRAALRAQLKQYGATSIPVRVWVGKDNLVYREQIQATLAGTGTANVTIEFYDYGKPVAVDVPAESDSLTVTPAEFLHLLGLGQ